MKEYRISKNTWAPMVLTILMAVLGGWSAGNERTAKTDTRVTILEQKCEATNERMSENNSEIIKRLDLLVSDMSEVKTGIALLNETKADRKYTE